MLMIQEKKEGLIVGVYACAKGVTNFLRERDAKDYLIAEVTSDFSIPEWREALPVLKPGQSVSYKVWSRSSGVCCGVYETTFYELKEHCLNYGKTIKDIEEAWNKSKFYRYEFVQDYDLSELFA